MKELTCIVCPIGCQLSIEEKDGQLIITGNRCPRGAAYAEEELRAPKRVVTATCRIINTGTSTDIQTQIPHRLPVKSTTPCPKEQINDLLRDIYQLKVTLPVKAGDVLLHNWHNSGLDFVATRSLEADSTTLTNF
jgi:CxxC motif-containing protein